MAIWQFVRQQSLIPVHIGKTYHLDEHDNIIVNVEIRTMNPDGIVVFRIQPVMEPPGEDPADSWKHK